MKCAVGMIKRVETGVKVVDGAGVRINRLMGAGRLSHIDPFVLLDEIRSSKPDDYMGGFPTHPHRGIETITYVLKGSVRHKDSKGNGGLITAGSVQWMTAGSGILHSEMPEKGEGGFWGYQLWLSLPAAMKMTTPGYQHLTPEMIPTVEKDGVTVKVISGSWEGAASPTRNIVESVYLDVRIKGASKFTAEMPEGGSGFVYVHTGAAALCPDDGGAVVREGSIAELAGPSLVEIKASGEEAGLLFVRSRPLNEPIVRGGPFVMNTEEEIRRAYEDYRNGRLG